MLSIIDDSEGETVAFESWQRYDDRLYDVQGWHYQELIVIWLGPYYSSAVHTPTNYTQKGTPYPHLAVLRQTIREPRLSRCE